MGSARVISGQAHRLHHRLGARHVEGHLVLARQGLQALHVLQHARVVGPQHRTQRSSGRGTLCDALLVKVVAEQVDSVGTCEIKELVAVQITHLHASRGLHEAAHAQMLPQVRAVLEGHAVAAGELQIGDARPSFGRGLCAQGIPLGIQAGQRLEPGLAPNSHLCWRVIACKKALLAVGVARDQRSHSLGHARVARQRTMLGARQLDTPLQPRQAPGDTQRQSRKRRHGGQRESFFHGVDPFPAFVSNV